MNVTTIAALIVLFFGGLCILVGYTLSNAIYKLRITYQNRKNKKEGTA